jgi:hypothetical protein
LMRRVIIIAIFKPFYKQLFCKLFWVVFKILISKVCDMPQ